MFSVQCEPLSMAKKRGRPPVGLEMTSIRIEKDTSDLAAKAGRIFGETRVAYVTRIVRERAEADILEDARRTLAKKPKGKGKGMEGD